MLAGLSRIAVHRTFRTSAYLLADLVHKVPGMGDSITEGSLIKLVKAVGSPVALDEVVAVIETDKVCVSFIFFHAITLNTGPFCFGAPGKTLTPPHPSLARAHDTFLGKVSVDVRSPAAGTLKSYHAALNDTVAVGAPLFTLDTSGAGASAAAPAASPSTPAPVAPAPAAAAPVVKPAAPSPPSASSSSSSSHRIPSISFRHGVRSSAPAAASSSSTVATGDYLEQLSALYPSKAGAKPELSVSPSYGRPPLAIDGDESFFIFSGGAYGKPPPPPPEKKGAKK